MNNLRWLPKPLFGVLRRLNRIRINLKWVGYILGIKAWRPYYLRRHGGSSISQLTSSKRDRWGEAFHYYAKSNNEKYVDLIWAEYPCPGNFGDWLSPYIINIVGGVGVNHISEVERISSPHIVALGSIMSSVNAHSIVLGTGISSISFQPCPDADYVSVRGPYTSSKIKHSAGHMIHMGDIGFLMRRVYSPKTLKGCRYLLVRHINHRSLILSLPEEVLELDIFASHPKDIEAFVDVICNADYVITSAMHCYIVCKSYGIPCVLVNFKGAETAVPGDGIKYKDAMEGVGLTVDDSICLGLDIKMTNIKCLDFNRDRVSDESLDNIELAIDIAINKASYSI